MDSPWDGRERRRGPSIEELRKRLRELEEAWDAEHRGTRPERSECNDKKADVRMHRDNDEERLVRVDAILEKFRARKNTTRKTVLRWKMPGGPGRVAKKM
jgi:hypothetical protein